MKQGNLDIVFNNGRVRQLLMLPETPLKIIFLFDGKELILRERYGKPGLYVISHQKGFSGTDTTCELDQERKLTSEDKVPETETHSYFENKDTSQERFEESSGVSSKGQALNAATSQRNAVSTKDFQTANGEICNNNVHSSTVKGNALKNSVKKSTRDGSQAIFGEIIYSQPKGPASNVIANQDKIVTVQTLEKQNKKIVYEIVFKKNQNETESYTTQSKTCTEAMCNQDEITHGIEEVDNNDISDSDDAVDFGFSFSDLSEDEDNNVNKSRSSLIKNKLSEIFGNHDKKESKKQQEPARPPTFRNANKCYKTKRRCAICLKRDVAGECAYSKFPADPEISDMWAKASGRKKVMEATHRSRQYLFVCSNHFTASDYMRQGSRRLKKNAVPSRNLPKLPTVKQQNTELIGRLKSKLQLALHKTPENVPQIQK